MVWAMVWFTVNKQFSAGGAVTPMALPGLKGGNPGYRACYPAVCNKDDISQFRIRHSVTPYGHSVTPYGH